jgi:hypothetical protein
MKNLKLSTLLSAVSVIFAIATTTAIAKAPCGDLGECKALVEINSSDGDIGFHFLMDGDDLVSGRVKNPDGSTIFKSQARGEFREQFMTETFVESAEPLCFDPLTDEDPENDEDDFVTLEDFLARWSAGSYTFVGIGDDDSRATGRTNLKFNLPAAPKNLDFDSGTGVISWDAGNDLGECATQVELRALVDAGSLPAHPKNVHVAMWEVVFEADVEDDDPSKGLKFTIRVPGDIAVKEVTVPQEFLDSLPDDTPAKYEIGSIGDGANATFTEEGEICVNENAGCAFEE